MAVPESMLLTPANIASLSQVSVKTVYRAIRSGALSAIAIGGRYRITREAYGDWITRQAVAPQPDAVSADVKARPTRGSLEALRGIEEAA
jgi:excisionase family DNA binding protein